MQKDDSSSSTGIESSTSGIKILTMWTYISTRLPYSSQQLAAKSRRSSSLGRPCQSSLSQLRQTNWQLESRVTRHFFRNSSVAQSSRQRASGWSKMTSCTFNFARWGKQKHGAAPARATRPWIRSLRLKYKRTSCLRGSKKKTLALILVKLQWMEMCRTRENLWAESLTSDKQNELLMT